MATFGHFVWTDLSSFDLEAACNDYAQLFGWSFPSPSDYQIATYDEVAVAGMFLMPPELASMNLPSFWMSYIHVNKLEEVVEKARSFQNARIEVERLAISDNAKIALIRDPSGAGFTIYEGPEIETSASELATVAQRYYHSRNPKAVEDFYHHLFGWRFEQRETETLKSFSVIHPDGTQIAIIEQIPDEIRGRFTYWMPSFSVVSLSNSVKTVENLGGEKIGDVSSNRALLADRQGAQFMVESVNTVQKNIAQKMTMPPIPWKSILSLCLIWLAVYLEIDLVWGLIFLLWSIPSLITGQSFFVEMIYRSKNPLTFWAINFTWISLSIWMILNEIWKT